MNKIINGNFQIIKDTIVANFELVKKLLQQAEQLNKLVDTLSDEDKKIEMNNIIRQINSDIDKIGQQTFKLFELYMEELER